MTFTASWRLDQPAAEHLADTLAELTEATAVDLVEATGGEFVVTAYFLERPDEDGLASVAGMALDNPEAATIAELAEENWVEKSLRALAPVRAGRFFVHGSHDRGRCLANNIAIEIDAGLAFGTGHHGTTTGCLLALDALRRREHIRSALDIGTGTGVLAIAIACAWHVPVIATDIDPTAVRVAADNTRINRVAGLVQCLRADGLHHRDIGHRQFDLVIANILAGPLSAMATAVTTHIAPGGSLVLSGLLASQRRWIVAAYRDRGCVFRHATVIEGWLTLVFEKPAIAGR